MAKDDVLEQFPIQICYATPSEELVLNLKVKPGCTVIQAFHQAHLFKRFARAIENGDIGIYGKRVSLDRKLVSGDRIEIYRALMDLPQNIRRRRVEQMREKKESR